MASERNRENYMMVDQRNAPPVPDWLLRAAGLPTGFNKKLMETAVYRCNHCTAQVVLNPDRSRERAWCRTCKSRICDACKVVMNRTLECVPFEKAAERALAAAVRAESGAPTSPIILPA